MAFACVLMVKQAAAQLRHSGTLREAQQTDRRSNGWPMPGTAVISSAKECMHASSAVLEPPVQVTAKREASTSSSGSRGGDMAPGQLKAQAAGKQSSLLGALFGSKSADAATTESTTTKSRGHGLTSSAPAAGLIAADTERRRERSTFTLVAPGDHRRRTNSNFEAAGGEGRPSGSRGEHVFSASQLPNLLCSPYLPQTLPRRARAPSAVPLHRGDSRFSQVPLLWSSSPRPPEGAPRVLSWRYFLDILACLLSFPAAPQG